MTSILGKANRSKDTFRKYIDSVLQKSAKIRGLIGDLRKNYCEDEHAKKFLSNNCLFFGSFIYPIKSQLIFFYPFCKLLLSPVPSPYQVAPPERPRSIEALDQDLATLDNEYNTLSDHMAKGEQDDFNPEWFGNLMALGLYPMIWYGLSTFWDWKFWPNSYSSMPSEVGKGSRGKDESIDFHVAH